MPPPILGTRHLSWPVEDACAAFAADLAGRSAIADAVIELRGALGAGKTAFARHLLRALGVTGRIKSPSYALMEPYRLAAGGSAAHLDFYRCDDAREWLDAGLREVYAAPGLKIAEWPENAGALLPTPDLRLTIVVGEDDTRSVTAEALTPRGLTLLG